MPHITSIAATELVEKGAVYNQYILPKAYCMNTTGNVIKLDLKNMTVHGNWPNFWSDYWLRKFPNVILVAQMEENLIFLTVLMNMDNSV